MSRQSEAKERQGYIPAVTHLCKNCLDLEMRQEKETPEWRKGYPPRSFPFCGLGGFAVKMGGTCRQCRVKEG